MPKGQFERNDDPLNSTTTLDFKNVLRRVDCDNDNGKEELIVAFEDPDRKSK